MSHLIIIAVRKMRFVIFGLVLLLLLPGVIVGHHQTSTMVDISHKLVQSGDASPVKIQFLGSGVSSYSSRLWNTSLSATLKPDRYTNVTVSTNGPTGTYIFLPGQKVTNTTNISGTESLSNLSGWSTQDALGYRVSSGSWFFNFQVNVSLSPLSSGGNGNLGAAVFLYNSTSEKGCMVFKVQNGSNVFSLSSGVYHDLNFSLDGPLVNWTGKYLIVEPFLNVTAYPSLITSPLAAQITLANDTISLGVGIENGNASNFSYPFYGSLSGTISPSFANLTINGTIQNTASGVFNISLSPGTYTVDASYPYYRSNSSAVSITSGQVDKIHISLVKLYNLSVSETGLPRDTPWNISVNGKTVTVTNSSYTSLQSNGTYYVNVSSTVNITRGVRFVNNTNSTKVSISGGNRQVNFTYSEEDFIALSPNNSTEGGTSPASGWYLHGSTVKISAVANPGYRFYFWVGNGNGSYSGSNSTANVTSESPINETAWFYPLGVKVYNVTFIETGLLQGTEWSVIFNGSEETSSNSLINFVAKNGSYNFTISHVKGYSANITAATVLVNGENILVNVNYELIKFKVEFVENGLPRSRFPWVVNLSNSIESSFNTTIEFYAVNGTYHFMASRVSGYVTSPLSGNLTVNGTPIIMPITFSEILYNVTFLFYGYQHGTLWGVKITNDSMQSYYDTNTSGTITVPLPQGSYNYTTFAEGYAGATNITFIVQSRNLVINLSFRPSSSPSSGQNAIMLHYAEYLLLPGLLAALSIFYLYRRRVSGSWNDIFIIYKDGRLIRHYTRRMNPDMDQDLISASLLAIQKAIKEASGRKELRHINLSGAGISIISGKLISLALMGSGKLSRRQLSRLEDVIKRIEITYQKELDGWKGDQGSVDWVDTFRDELYP